jgi:hypothetical protein
VAWHDGRLIPLLKSKIKRKTLCFRWNVDGIDVRLSDMEIQWRQAEEV